MISEGRTYAGVLLGRKNPLERRDEEGLDKVEGTGVDEGIGRADHTDGLVA